MSATAWIVDTCPPPCETSPPLIDATRDAFTSGTSLGLRVGAALILLTTAAVAHQHPKE